MKKLLLIICLVLFATLCNAATSLYPTGHPENAVSATFERNNEHFEIYIWEESGDIWLECEPIDGEPFVCQAYF